REQSNRAIESLDLIPSSEYKSALRLLCELSLERNS
ncbi:MAG: octaprenyl diphosphate synthase, partial [Thiotrichales bacterium]|nr:octaprenyl diphosphate synthase [Thiotrichales bacterium]